MITESRTDRRALRLDYTEPNSRKYSSSLYLAASQHDDGAARQALLTTLALSPSYEGCTPLCICVVLMGDKTRTIDNVLSEEPFTPEKFRAEIEKFEREFYAKKKNRK